MESISHWLALKSVPGIGNRLFLQLVKEFGTPEKVFTASAGELLKVEGVNNHLSSVIHNYKVPAQVEEDLNLVKKSGFKIITFSDPDYPSLLRHIHDPPPVLYIYGKLRPDSLNIAIVGSRNATSYGRTVTERLSGDLARRGFTVVSGMAQGIDSAAHIGALSAGGETIAVLGCGLGTIYPAQNKGLFHRIAQSGAVISEFPFLTPPEAHNFPIRNRIISGLSLGTVVVEATNKSGSLITARLAAEQGREVFAVPGSVTSFKSMGTHRLIKEGVKLVENVNDIIEELNIQQAMPPALHEEVQHILLSADEEKILNELGPYPIHIDKLVRQVSFSAGKVSSLLLQLELKGLVTQSPGKLFTRVESKSI
ncbi:MAG: DNA-protecting protein DprA [Deltaproteobacteria bacterium]|nr:DNA-protecting protein DprA [Deltaproteobacteria bacterium]RLC12587.1 MAG: DNA-protecting protein DprA [Deltaproteobacteria bacterium]